jgi:hypothetical protein
VIGADRDVAEYATFCSHLFLPPHSQMHSSSSHVEVPQPVTRSTKSLAQYQSSVTSVSLYVRCWSNATEQNTVTHFTNTTVQHETEALRLQGAGCGKSSMGDSSVGVVTVLRTGCSGVRFLAGIKGLSLLLGVRTACGAHPVSHSTATSTLWQG